MEVRRLRTLVRAMSVLSVTAATLVFAPLALGNAANPVAGSTVVDQVVVNPDGSTTVTVQGQWDWASQTKCPSARNGVGYQVDWFDNQSNSIGTANSPDGILYVGTANDNIVHSDETLGGSSAFGNAFWDGVPSSYGPFAGTSSDTTPTATDAAHWFGECSGQNAQGVTAGTWGPITHTYSATATKPLQLCPIMYDPHGGSQNSGKSSVKDITAGSNASDKGTYNDDNSYQTNGVGPDGNQCPKISIPALSTSASPSMGTVGQTFHDMATLTGTSGSGTISWSLYPAGSNCSGNPLATDTLSVSGDGTYTNPHGYTATATGTYQWQASYSSPVVKGLITNCSDKSEQFKVSPAQPKVVTDSTRTAVVGDVIKDNATLSGGNHPTGTITWHLYSDSACTNLVDTITVPVSGDGTYTASPGYTTSNPGVYYWVADYSGDANNNPASTKCGDPKEETTVNSPGINVVKLDSVPCADVASGASQPTDVHCAGKFTTFTQGIITVSVPASGSYSIPIDYQIRVTNTGSTPLALSLDDPLCDSGSVSGPILVSGTLTGTTLSAGGAAYYTCTHTLTQNDPNTSVSGQPFTNTATVTGTPPSGPPVKGTDIVTVDRQPLPPPKRRHFCRAFRAPHKKILWRHFPKDKPAACQKPPSKPPKNPHGFTG